MLGSPRDVHLDVLWISLKLLTSVRSMFRVFQQRLLSFPATCSRAACIAISELQQRVIDGPAIVNECPNCVWDSPHCFSVILEMYFRVLCNVFGVSAESAQRFF